MAAVTLPEFPEKSRIGTPGFPEFPTPPFRGVGFRDRDGTCTTTWRKNP